MAYRGPGRAYFEEVSARIGHRVGELEKCYRLVELLERIRDDRLLADALLLKGGTALHLLHLGLRRLSVDLDFNFAGSAERESMLRVRPEVERQLVKAVGGLGYRVQPRPPAYALTSYRLRYVAATGTPDAVKIEVNFLDRVPLTDPIVLPARHPFDLASPSVATYGLPELAAGKIRALLSRMTPRDVFDAAVLSEAMGPEIRSPLRELAVLGCAFDGHDLRGASFDVRVEPGELERKLLPVISRRDADTVSQVEQQAGRFINPLRTLSEKENRFLGRFFDDLQFDPEVVLEGLEHRKGIERHPAAEWILRGLKGKRNRERTAAAPS